MILHLKIKICTLQAEAKIIRQQEQRLLKRIKPLIFAIPTSEPSDKIKEIYRLQRIPKKLYKSQLAKIRLGKPWSSIQDHRRGIIRWEARYNGDILQWWCEHKQLRVERAIVQRKKVVQ